MPLWNSSLRQMVLTTLWLVKKTVKMQTRVWQQVVLMRAPSGNRTTWRMPLNVFRHQQRQVSRGTFPMLISTWLLVWYPWRALTYLSSAQLLCSFETVALGYSNFCELFTLTEWKGYEYSFALQLAGNNLFQSPTGRAVGIGYVEEFLARLEHHYIFNSDSQVNTTLDNNPTTFPLDQTLYFDFSHVATITGVLTAFGITQFAQFLPTSGKSCEMVKSQSTSNIGVG